MDEKALFAERLRQAMQAAGYPPKGSLLEREFNQRYWGKPVSLQAVCRWLRGEAIPSQDKLEALSEWLKIEPQELRFGAEAVQKVRSARSLESAISYQEREIFEAFLALPAPQKRVVREVILAFSRLARLPAE